MLAKGEREVQAKGECGREKVLSRLVVNAETHRQRRESSCLLPGGG